MKLLLLTVMMAACSAQRGATIPPAAEPLPVAVPSVLRLTAATDPRVDESTAMRYAHDALCFVSCSGFTCPGDFCQACIDGSCTHDEPPDAPAIATN